jgi:hypothetical protein
MVKHSFTTPLWANEISVKREPQVLIVTGKNHTAKPVAGIAVEANLLAQSVPLARWPGNRRKKPPHIEFANATTDAKLIEFVEKWGPVDGSPMLARYAGNWERVDGVPTKTSSGGFTVVVRQNFARLRLEQKEFSATARLIAEIQSNDPNPERVFNYLCALPDYALLPDPAEKEIFFNAAKKLNRGQSLARAVCQHAQCDLCRLLDQFHPVLFPTTEGPVELPPMDRGSIGKGIKHVLYGFLRLEYLQRDRLGLGVCPHCEDVFAKEREGVVYCDEDCSKRHRSLEYYREHGRAKRREKAAKSH